MTPVELALDTQLVLVLAGVVAAIAAPPRLRSLLAGVLSALLGLAGVLTGAWALAGRHGVVELPTALSLGPVTLDPTPLGGFFMVVAGAVGAVAAVFAIGYASGPAASRTSWVALAVFLGAMQLVPAAGDLVSFLLMWELMALASTVLVLTEHAGRAEVRTAALWYAAMTHLSFVLVLLGFTVLAHAGGGIDWASMSRVDPTSRTAAVAFLLLVAGFATKAGVVPVHVWLPRAHPAAPSHVSAVMSAAMVKMGVYGVLLVSIRLMPGGPAWWGAVVVGLGAVSAVYGILQASVASDLKRLLGYSTTENIGLIFLALGTALILRAHQVSAAGDAALLACLLLVASHAAFKATLFLGAGSVLHATGERDLDRMGGLVSRLPVTATAFGIGALGAAALPVTAGFVAEWTLLQAVIHGGRPHDRMVAVTMPIAVSVVALTAGLALVTFVKAYGIAFLARARSDGAAQAHEASPSMRAAMLIAACVVLILGLVPGALAQAAARAVGLPAGSAVTQVGFTHLGARLEPLAVLVLVGVMVTAVALIAKAAARKVPRREVELAWGGGGVRASARMQYTATSYAEPLTRVFDDALRPERDVVVTHAGESRYLVERVQFHQHVVDLVEDRMYRPMLTLVERLGVAGRRLQNGSIHRYLAYSFFALVVVLVVVAL
ncbi:hydrogenase 4 subunit B [Nocardioides agariphilus]|uniref:Hydrogenase 4 subunit B n=1 Tax=Nocardioides agariphilus TaxID=433664 RepID=A0A930VGM7_9ACTN|nr:hydrogenase 4 subunit B [Nocardioides agariphilus]